MSDAFPSCDFDSLPAEPVAAPADAETVAAAKAALVASLGEIVSALLEALRRVDGGR